MASVATREPEFLAARRERAAVLKETLQLPNFKGTAGWEFTDISALDLDAFTAAPAASNGTEECVQAETSSRVGICGCPLIEQKAAR